MLTVNDLSYRKIPLNNGSGAIPALGFGTLIPDPVATRVATKAALEAGFRLLAVTEITEGIKTRVRFNSVAETGVPGFIPRGK